MEQTREMENEKNKTFGIMSIIFGFFFALCFYKAGTGISVPIFAIGNCFYILAWIKILGVKPKKETWFYLGSTILLASSAFLSTNIKMLGFTKMLMLILYFCFMIYQLHEDTKWGFIKYIMAIINTIGKTILKLNLPIKDFLYYNNGRKNKVIKNIFLGVIISIPFVAVVLLLLSRADAIFANIVPIDKFIKTSDVINFILIGIFAYFIIYAYMKAVEKKDIEPVMKEGKREDAIIAITFTSILSFVYFIFSGIQIFALFLGEMDLPSGYTYAKYAREGFLQLLIICIINMLIVLFCLEKFKDAKTLRIILTCLSLCTYVIIASSVFRIIMYIKEYNLSFLRIFVFWALLVVSFLMLGVMLRIYRKDFPSFRYSLAIITIFYMIFVFMKPDFIIAKYNLGNMIEDSKSTDQEIYYYQDMDYVYSLSTDIMPAIRDFIEREDYLLFNEKDRVVILLEMNAYLDKVNKEKIQIRTFNIGQYMAKQDAKICKEKIE